MPTATASNTPAGSLASSGIMPAAERALLVGPASRGPGLTASPSTAKQIVTPTRAFRTLILDPTPLPTPVSEIRALASDASLPGPPANQHGIVADTSPVVQPTSAGNGVAKPALPTPAPNSVVLTRSE
jgi:hypothetical protein